MSTAKYPSLGTAVPLYDWLMDKIEDFQSKTRGKEMKSALGAAMEKLKSYYARSDDSWMYPIATS